MTPVACADADLLTSVLSLLVGSLWGGDIPPRTVRKLADKFVAAGRLDAEWTERDLRSRLEDLIQGLRFAQGVYAEAPPPCTSPPRDPDDRHERGL